MEEYDVGGNVIFTTYYNDKGSLDYKVDKDGDVVMKWVYGKGVTGVAEAIAELKEK